LLEQDIVVAVTADHTTDSNSGYHTSDPVPALLFSRQIQERSGASGSVIEFGESACRTGNMERQSSVQFLKKVIDEMSAA